MRIQLLVVLGTLLLFLGCSASQEVVSDGPFQKRKFRKGWHVDLPLRDRPSQPDRGSRSDATERLEPLLTHTEAHADLHGTPIRAPLMPPALEAPPVVAQVRARLRPGPRGAEPIHSTPSALPEPNAEQAPRWNRMALVSGVFLVLSVLAMVLTGGGGVLAYLLVFAFATGLVGLLLAIKHHERGKGIAIAAIALPLVLLALVIATLNVVW